MSNPEITRIYHRGLHFSKEVEKSQNLPNSFEALIKAKSETQ